MALPLRNGKVDIDAPTDEQAKQCAWCLKMQPSVRSIELRHGSITSAGATFIAKGLKGGSTEPPGVASWQSDRHWC